MNEYERDVIDDLNYMLDRLAKQIGSYQSCWKIAFFESFSHKKALKNLECQHKAIDLYLRVLKTKLELEAINVRPQP